MSSSGGAAEPGAPEIENEPRSALEARVHRMEAALSAIDRETQHALHHPEISLTTLCRIATILLQARGR